MLIINTFCSANWLQEKERGPESETVKWALKANVLLIRTLDLLRFADLVERNIKTKKEFKDVLLGESGWLKVVGDSATAEKQ